MEETLVSFKVAELAKKKGFNVPCSYYYERSKILIYFGGNKYSYTTIDKTLWSNMYLSAPTQDLLQKLLREIHRIYVYIIPIHNIEIGGLISDNYQICIEDYMGRKLLEKPIYIHGYDETREEALFQALNLLPDKI